jgi:hypothetical protein
MANSAFKHQLIDIMYVLTRKVESINRSLLRNKTSKQTIQKANQNVLISCVNRDNQLFSVFGSVFEYGLSAEEDFLSKLTYKFIAVQALNAEILIDIWCEQRLNKAHKKAMLV